MRSTSAAAAPLVVALAGASPAQQPQLDLLLRNGRIIDGTGNSWFRGDVALRGDTIVRIAASCGFDPSLAGKTLADVTQQRGMEPTVENAAEATLWIVEPGGYKGIFNAMSDDDVQRIMLHARDRQWAGGVRGRRDVGRAAGARAVRSGQGSR